MKSVVPAFQPATASVQPLPSRVRFSQDTAQEDPVARAKKPASVVRLPDVVIDDAKPQDAQKAFPVWLAGFQDGSTAPWVKQSTNSPLRRLQMEDAFINGLWVREEAKRSGLGDQVVVMRDRAHDEIVGLAALTRILNRFRPHKLPEGFISTLAVHPDHRGKGYGRRLTEHLVELARQRGFSQVRVLASDNNRAFLEHLGFEHHPQAHRSLPIRLLEWAANKLLGTPYLMRKPIPQPQFET